MNVLGVKRYYYASGSLWLLSFFQNYQRKSYPTTSNFRHWFIKTKLKYKLIIIIDKIYINRKNYFQSSQKVKLQPNRIIQEQNIQMSWDYGWNAQSALLPQKDVHIKVGDRGNQKIRAEMQSIKAKNSNETKSKIWNLPSNKIKQVKKNRGIEQRVKNDQQSKSLQNPNDSKSYQMIKKHLQAKSKIYNQIQKNPKNHSSFLVDFQQKQLSKDEQETQQLKKEFYAGKLKQLIEQQNKIHEADYKGFQHYMRENLAWQKQVLQELNGQLTQTKSKVAQSFDRKLTEQQKSALQKVIQQRAKQKQRIIEIQELRQQQGLQRMRKLRKLDILDSDSEN